MKKKWYQTILGIIMLVAVFLTLFATIQAYFVDKSFISTILTYGSIISFIYFIFHHLTEYLVLKMAEPNKRHSNVPRIMLSFIFIIFPIIIYTIIANPEYSTNRKIIYVLPENFYGKFTINFNSSVESGDRTYINDTCIMYFIEPSGVFYTSNTFVRSANGSFPTFYLHSNMGVQNIPYFDIPILLPNRNLVVCYYDLHTNWFKSIDQITYVIDSTQNLNHYDKIRYARDVLKNKFYPQTQ